MCVCLYASVYTNAQLLLKICIPSLVIILVCAHVQCMFYLHVLSLCYICTMYVHVLSEYTH